MVQQLQILLLNPILHRQMRNFKIEIFPSYLSLFCREHFETPIRTGIQFPPSAELRKEGCQILPLWLPFSLHVCCHNNVVLRIHQKVGDGKLQFFSILRDSSFLFLSISPPANQKGQILCSQYDYDNRPPQWMRMCFDGLGALCIWERGYRTCL